MIVSEGQEAFAKMLMQGDNTIVAAGGNFYLGACGATIDQADTLSDIAGEPTSAGGYARQAIERNTTGFPTVSQVNGIYRALSKSVTFSASGADFSTAFRRFFLTTAASGTTGTLFSYSGVFPSLQINDGQSQNATWELYLNW